MFFSFCSLQLEGCGDKLGVSEHDWVEVDVHDSLKSFELVRLCGLLQVVEHEFLEICVPAQLCDILCFDPFLSSDFGSSGEIEVRDSYQHALQRVTVDRKSTRLNSSHSQIS